jgi:hypothetical protein
MIPHEVGVKLENTMAKTKMIKGKTTIYKTLHIHQLQKFNGRRHDLVNRYGVYLLQMTTDMCHLS